MPSSHKISLDAAKALTKRYRDSIPKLLDGTFATSQPLFQSATFDRDAIDSILAQPNCSSFKIYLGMNEKQELVPILIGVDEEGQELIAEIMDEGKKCPPFCDPPGTLQS